MDLERWCELPHLSTAEVRELTTAVSRLVAALRPERVYVFGSQSRGDTTADSDIDLLVVVAEADQSAHRLAQAAYRAAAPQSLPLDILVMSREEFERRSRARASLPAAVLREGRLLYAA